MQFNKVTDALLRNGYIRVSDTDIHGVEFEIGDGENVVRLPHCAKEKNGRKDNGDALWFRESPL